MDRFHIISYYDADKFYTLYKGLDSLTNSLVWIKILSSDFYYSKNFSLKFDLWADRLLSLDSPYIVKYISFLRDINEFRIINYFFEPNPLSDILAKENLPLHKVKNYFLQILHAFNTIHDNNLINGEIELNKIHIINDTVLMEDVGIKNLLFSSLKLNDRFFYTDNISFFSPEQIKSASVDHRSDIYSLGVLLYTMIQGNHPYSDIIDKTIIKEKILSEPLPKPLRTNIFDTIIQKATEKEPEKRYQSIQEFIDDVEKINIPYESTKIKNPSVQKRPSVINIEINKPTDFTNELKSSLRPVINNNIQTQPKPKKLKHKHSVSIAAILSALLLLLFNGLIFKSLIQDFNAPANALHILVQDNITSSKCGTYQNKIFVTAHNSDGLYYFFNIDKSIPQYLLKDPYQINLKNFEYIYSAFSDGIYYVCGGKELGNGEINPAFYQIYHDHYEPFYNIDESAEYLAVAPANNKLYFVKKNFNSQSSVSLEIRNWDLSLDNQVKLIEIEKQTSSIDILNFAVYKNYVFTYYSVPKENILSVWDTSGHFIWSSPYNYNIYSTKTFLLQDTIFIALSQRKQSDHITIKKYSIYGRLLQQIPLTLNCYIANIQKLLISPKGQIFLLLDCRNRQILIKANFSGKILWQKKMPKPNNIKITDLKLSDGQIIATGVEHYKLFDLLYKNQKISFIYLFTIDSSGNYPKLKLSSVIKEMIKTNPKN